MNAIDSRGVRDPELDSTSDLDEPMGSQSADVEAPLTHNSSKSNFFASPESEQATPDQQLIANSKTPANRGSFKTHVRENAGELIFPPTSFPFKSFFNKFTALNVINASNWSIFKIITMYLKSFFITLLLRM